MKLSKNKNKILISMLILIGVILGVGAFAFGQRGISPFNRDNYIVVTGNSSNVVANQKATFSANVTVLDEDKSEAVKEMNERVTSVMEELKAFGIAGTDLKTSYVNVYQEQNWDPTEQKPIFGDWRATTTIEIRLSDTSKATALTELLTSSEVSDIFGPNFTTDQGSIDEATLLSEALKDARKKAEAIAMASGRRLGKLIKFEEGFGTGQVYPAVMYDRVQSGGGGAMPVEPGGSEVSKTVTVTYQLR